MLFCDWRFGGGFDFVGFWCDLCFGVCVYVSCSIFFFGLLLCLIGGSFRLGLIMVCFDRVGGLAF